MNYEMTAQDRVKYDAWLRATQDQWLKSLDEMDPVARRLYICHAKFLILSESKKHNDVWRDKVERWYNNLKDIMMRHGIKKSDLTAHGLSWGACAKLYHAAVG